MHVYLINCAIDLVDGERGIYCVSEEKYEEYPKYTGIQSFSKNHLIKHGIKSTDINTISTKTLSFESLKNKYSIGTIDMLVLDCEGYDKILIEDFLVTSSYRPVIFFEHSHLKYIEYKNLCENLESNDYNMIKFYVDTIAVQKSMTDEMCKYFQSL